jgi:hypothetical protein
MLVGYIEALQELSPSGPRNELHAQGEFAAKKGEQARIVPWVEEAIQLT